MPFKASRVPLKSSASSIASSTSGPSSESSAMTSQHIRLRLNREEPRPQPQPRLAREARKTRPRRAASAGAPAAIQECHGHSPLTHKLLECLHYLTESRFLRDICRGSAGVGQRRGAWARHEGETDRKVAAESLRKMWR